MSKSKQNYEELFNKVYYIVKTRQDNDLTNHLTAFYAENNVELSLIIRPGVVFHKN